MSSHHDRAPDRPVPRLFVTGGSGFVGRRLLVSLEEHGYPFVALDHSGVLGDQFATSPNHAVVRGDLLEPDTYRDALTRTDIVLHLAASTGRATREEHFRVNARGTETLLDACTHAGVKNVLFVSSIAATFPDLTDYFYAQAKVAAEQAVLRSRLRFLILRPTMIFGPGSPIERGLSALAGLPVIPVFGNGRTRVQPVHVDDVVESMLEVLDADLFSNSVLEIGGPDVLTIAELLSEIRRARQGAARPVVRIPLLPVAASLRVAERLGLTAWLPLTAGQLSSFRYDGVAASHPFHEQRRSRPRGLAAMLAAGETALRPDDVSLASECHVFTQHLVGSRPGSYVLQKYAAAHATLPGLSVTSRFDRWLVRVARIHWLFAKAADGYAGLLAQESLLRQKLVLLLAILETCPPTYRRVDEVVGSGPASIVIKLFFRGCAAGVSALAGVLMFLPVKLAFSALDRKPR